MLYIVIPVFNRKKFTRECLLSLRKQTYQDFKTIIVDDGSTDGTDVMLRDEFPEVIILQGTGSLFWTAATNMGIRYALEQGAERVLTQNNDVIMVENYLEKMLYWGDKMPDALIGGLDYNYNTNKPYFGGEIINWATNSITDLLKTLPEDQQVGIHKVSHLPGRGLLIPRKVLEDVGLFAEKLLPHYAADYDYTLQAAKHGYPNYINYDAIIYSYPEESGDHENRKRRSMKNYYNHLFSIRGGANLKDFTIMAYRNCPPIYLPYYLMSGYARRMLGYWVK